jgi:glycosyltransferase involved in cell wall biosynthesis
MGAIGELQTILSPAHTRFEPSSIEAVNSARAGVGLGPEESYLIHVGGNSWYKNRNGVLRTMAALRQWPGFEDMRLVMVGAPWTREMYAIVAENEMRNAAIEATGIEDASLRALYTGAQALLFPSLYEGFGWPVLEAQSCGCVVITSNREPMTEVAGAAAILIDPEDPDAAAAEIVKLWPELEKLRHAGFCNAERFSPEVAMDAYEAFFRAESRGGESTSYEMR